MMDTSRMYYEHPQSHASIQSPYPLKGYGTVSKAKAKKSWGDLLKIPGRSKKNSQSQQNEQFNHNGYAEPYGIPTAVTQYDGRRNYLDEYRKRLGQQYGTYGRSSSNPTMGEPRNGLIGSSSVSYADWFGTVASRKSPSRPGLYSPNSPFSNPPNQSWQSYPSNQYPQYQSPPAPVIPATIPIHIYGNVCLCPEQLFSTKSKNRKKCKKCGCKIATLSQATVTPVAKVRPAIPASFYQMPSMSWQSPTAPPPVQSYPPRNSKIPAISSFTPVEEQGEYESPPPTPETIRSARSYHSTDSDVTVTRSINSSSRNSTPSRTIPPPPKVPLPSLPKDDDSLKNSIIADKKTAYELLHESSGSNFTSFSDDLSDNAVDEEDKESEVKMKKPVRNKIPVRKFEKSSSAHKNNDRFKKLTNSVEDLNKAKTSPESSSSFIPITRSKKSQSSVNISTEFKNEPKTISSFSSENLKENSFISRPIRSKNRSNSITITKAPAIQYYTHEPSHGIKGKQGTKRNSVDNLKLGENYKKPVDSFNSIDSNFKSLDNLKPVDNFKPVPPKRDMSKVVSIAGQRILFDKNISPTKHRFEQRKDKKELSFEEESSIDSWETVPESVPDIENKRNSKNFPERFSDLRFGNLRIHENSIEEEDDGWSNYGDDESIDQEIKITNIGSRRKENIKSNIKLEEDGTFRDLSFKNQRPSLSDLLKVKSILKRPNSADTSSENDSDFYIPPVPENKQIARKKKSVQFQYSNGLPTAVEEIPENYIHEIEEEVEDSSQNCINSHTDDLHIAENNHNASILQEVSRVRSNESYEDTPRSSNLRTKCMIPTRITQIPSRPNVPPPPPPPQLNKNKLSLNLNGSTNPSKVIVSISGEMECNSKEIDTSSSCSTPPPLPTSSPPPLEEEDNFTRFSFHERDIPQPLSTFSNKSMEDNTTSKIPMFKKNEQTPRSSALDNANSHLLKSKIQEAILRKSYNSPFQRLSYLSTTTEDTENDDRFNDHIYEELRSIASSPSNISRSLSPEKSLFDGASKYEILEFLRNAKKRVQIDDDDDLSIRCELEGEENEIKNHHEEPLISSMFSDGRSSNRSSNSDSSENSSLIRSDKERLQSGEIERTDSGVGSETSKPNVKLRKQEKSFSSTPAAVVTREGNQPPCDDCDFPVETKVTQGGLMYAPLVCHRCSRRRQERREILMEIIETEVKYGRDLKVMMDQFCRPMLVAGLLTKDQLGRIFLNIEELIENNRQFALQIKDAYEIALDQGDEDLLTVNVAKLFFSASNMLHAFQRFCVKQADASIYLQNLEKDRELLRIFLKVSQMENTLLRRMNLHSFLMVPVQRITKYPLLLSRLYKATPPSHASREDCRKAREKIELYLQHINNETKGSSSTKLWRRISMSVAGGSVPQKTPTRPPEYDTSLKLRSVAIDVLDWNNEEATVIREGRLLCLPPESGNWTRRGRTIKMVSAQVVLITLGRPLATLEEKVPEDGIITERDLGIKEAAILAFKDHRLSKSALLREPWLLSKVVLSWDAEGETENFELTDMTTKETFIFKDRDPASTEEWFRAAQFHALSVGSWRKRRSALANIMINGARP